MQLSAPIYRLKRRAKAHARDTGGKLHSSLDHVAQTEGFQSWDHLSAAHKSGPVTQILNALPEGSLSLLAARPGQGKTLMALELAVHASQRGPACFYTLDYSPAQIAERLEALGANSKNLTLDHSDDISADYIIAKDRPGFIAVDYLQLLDQRRSLPPLGEQCAALKAYAQASDSRIVMISQIHRSFDGSAATMPGTEDIRLPNPVDLVLFDRLIFLHDGQIAIKG